MENTLRQVAAEQVKDNEKVPYSDDFTFSTSASARTKKTSNVTGKMVCFRILREFSGFVIVFPHCHSLRSNHTATAGMPLCAPSTQHERFQRYRR